MSRLMVKKQYVKVCVYACVCTHTYTHIKMYYYAIGMYYKGGFAHSGSESKICLQYGAPKFNPWVRRSLGKGIATHSVFLENSMNRGYSPLQSQESDMTT